MTPEERPVTVTGDNRFVVVPSPNWPAPLPPMHFAAPLATQQLKPLPAVNIDAARSAVDPFKAPPPADTFVVGCSTTNVSINETSGIRRFRENIALNCTDFLVLAY
jgi:hypothetical protein